MAEISLRDYLKQVEVNLQAGRLTEVIAHSSHILKAYPKNAAAYRSLGHALLEEGRYAEAGEVFRRLLGALPTDFDANAQLSRIYAAQDEGEAALWHAERAFDQQPGDAATNQHLRQLLQRYRGVDVPRIQLTTGAIASQYLRTGMAARAIDPLRRALYGSHDRLDLQLQLAQALWQAGDPLEAAETALVVLKSLPYALEANRILAQLWLDEERPSDAQRYLSRMEEVDPYAALAVATGTAPPADAYMIEALNIAEYAAQADAGSPDWLDSLDDSAFQEPQDAEAEIPTPPATPIPSQPANLDEAFEDFSFEEEAQDEASFEDEPLAADDLFADLPDEPQGRASIGLTDLLGDAVDEAHTGVTDALDAGDDEDWLGDLGMDEDEPSSADEGRPRTGLTGMLGKYVDQDVEAEELDDWLSEVSASNETVLFDDAQAPPTSDGPVDDLFADLPASEQPSSEAVWDEDLEWMGDERPQPDAPDFFMEEQEAAPAEDEAPADPLAWLGDDDVDLDDEGEATPTGDAAPTSEAMAWLAQEGIEFDDSVEKERYVFDDEPAEVASEAADPLAWLGDTEFTEGSEGDDDDDPMAWLKVEGIDVDGDDSAPPQPDDTHQFEDEQEPPDTLDFDDEPAPPAPAEMMADSPTDSAQEGDWLSDDSLLDEMLEFEALTEDERDAFLEEEAAASDFFASDEDEPARVQNELAEDGQEPMSEHPDWMNEPPNEDDSDGMDWLDEANFAQDDTPEEDDPLAWLNESDVELSDEEADEDFDPQTMVTDHFAGSEDPFLEDDSEPDDEAPGDAFDFFGDDEEEEASQPADEPPARGRTGMLSRFAEGTLPVSEESPQGAEDDWFSEPAASEDDATLDWMSNAGDESDDDLWGDFGAESAEPPAEAADVDWLSQLDLGDEPQATDDPWGDFDSAEPEEPAAEGDAWLSSLEDAGLEDSDELDWLTALDEPQAEQQPPGAAAEDFSDVDDFDFGDEPPAASEEPDWLADIDLPAEGEQQPAAAAAEDFGDFDDFDFGEEQPAASEEPDWLADIDLPAEGEQQPAAAAAEDFGDFDDFDFGDEPPAASEEPDWLTDMDLPAEGEQQPAAAAAEDFGDFDDFDFGEEQPATAEETNWLADAEWPNEDEQQPAAAEDFGEFEEEEPFPADELRDEEPIGAAAFSDVDFGEEEPVSASDEFGFRADESAEEFSEFGLDAPVTPDEEPLEWQPEDDPYADSVEGLPGLLSTIRDGEAPEPEIAPELDESWQAEPPMSDEQGFIEDDEVLREPQWDEEAPVPSARGEEWSDLPAIPLPFEEAQQPLPLDEADELLPEAEQAPAAFQELDDYEEEMDFTPGENVPDWLNAMVPGLDIDYSAPEDEPLEESYTEGASHRSRILSEAPSRVASGGEFAWLQDIVDEETGLVSVGDADAQASPAARARRFLFSRLPAWLRGSKASQGDRTTQAAVADEAALAEEEPGSGDAGDAAAADLDDFDDFEFDDFDDE